MFSCRVIYGGFKCQPDGFVARGFSDFVNKDMDLIMVTYPNMGSSAATSGPSRAVNVGYRTDPQIPTAIAGGIGAITY